MYEMRRLMARWSRLGSGRGFGIQSPSAFQFVTEVVNPSRACFGGRLAKNDAKGLSKMMRRLFPLYQRMAADRQPRLILSCGQGYDVFRRCMLAAQSGARMADIDACGEGWQLLGEADMVRVVLGKNSKQLCRMAMERLQEKAVLMVEGIHLTTENDIFWNELTAHERGGETYDLFDCGLIFFEKKLYRQHYKINLKNRKSHENYQSIYKDRR